MKSEKNAERKIAEQQPHSNSISRLGALLISQTLSFLSTKKREGKREREREDLHYQPQLHLQIHFWSVYQPCTANFQQNLAEK